MNFDTNSSTIKDTRKMMQVKTNKANVGVIVARVQAHKLHDAHRELIDTVISRHAKVLIFLGLSQVKGSINDPLDYQPRKQMIFEAYPPSQYPNLTVHYIEDQPSDLGWSNKLDSQIKGHLSPRDTVVLYGGRDSFISRYQGKYPTLELEASRNISSTEIREELAAAPQSDPLFRAGMIYAAFQRYPTVYSTVDICLFDRANRRILLGRKLNETLYRFPGGFADVKDESFERAALRELFEETNLTCGLEMLNYLGSRKVDDWRYRNNPSEKIITHMYLGYYTQGLVKAGDDLAEARWVSYDGFMPESFLVTEHQELFKMVKKFVDEKHPVVGQK